MKRETGSKWHREKSEVRGGKGRRERRRGGGGGEGGEVSGDVKAEKLHFDGGKLNQLCNGGLRAERQIETVMSAPRDYCHLCVRVCVSCDDCLLSPSSSLAQEYLRSHCDSHSAHLWGE